MGDKPIDFKTAILAKEKGFDIETLYCYLENGELQYSSGDDGDHDGYNHNKWDNISRPSQSLLQKYLREIHKIDVIPTMSEFSRTYGYKIFYIENGKTEVINNCYSKYENPEESLEVGLVEALKLIK